MFSGCRLINISGTWLVEHRAAYQAWAATEEGAAQLARATLTGPAPLRSPLSPAEERRVLAALDAGAARESQLQRDMQRLHADIEAGAVREGLLRMETQRLMEQYRQRCAEADEEAAATLQALADARQETVALRRRLALSESRQRRERRRMCAVAGAVQAAEMAATARVERLRSRAPPALPPLLAEHLRRTAAGDGSNSRARRTARQLLSWLADRLAS